VRATLVRLLPVPVPQALGKEATLARKGRIALRPLARLVAEAFPELDADEAIRRGLVRVGRAVLTNPASRVRSDAALSLVGPGALRGEAKLRAGLVAFRVCVARRVALDLGAAAGGFTRVLLEAGARRVYAVDVGHGQLLGSLRQDPRVVNLERTNLADLSTRLVPETIEVLTADLSYVPLAEAIPQLTGRVRFAADAELVALVKPQFELRLGKSPRGREVEDAFPPAAAGLERAGWRVLGGARSPVRGAGGSDELLLHARRA
jgi:23S rRNA (cytidine1920-2'-O)/16S rRNA (cytidine1409-2'-O)-methyltransferase